MRRAIGCSLLVLLFLASLAIGEIKVVGDAKIAAYKMARLSVSGADDAIIFWGADREDLLDIEELDGKAIITGPPGNYTIKVNAIWLEAGKRRREVVRYKLTIEGGVAPPPDPDDKGKPVPTTGPYWILVVEETSEASSARGPLFASSAVAARLKAKGHKYRIVDKDVKDSTGRVPRDLAPWLERVKASKLPRVLFVDFAGNIAYEGDMVRTAADLLKILDKLGG